MSDEKCKQKIIKMLTKMALEPQLLKRNVLEILTIPIAEAFLELNKTPFGYYVLAKAHEVNLDYESAVLAFNEVANLEPSSKLLEDLHLLDINILRRHLRNNNARIHKIDITYLGKDYRGMIATGKINKGEPLIEIPLDMCITMTNALKNEYNSKLNRIEINLSSREHTYMALELLCIKSNKKHKCTPYIRCLPKSFDSMPSWFDKDMLGLLKGSYALVYLYLRKHRVEQDYRHILAVFPELPYSLEEYIWARNAVISRIYQIKYNGKDETVMVPFADLANHSSKTNTHWRAEGNKFVVVAIEKIKQGATIYETYGPKSNYRFFVNYGFTIEDNADEQVAVIMDSTIHNMLDLELYRRDINCLLHIDQAKSIFSLSYKIDKVYMDMIKYTTQLLKFAGKTPTTNDVLTYIHFSMKRSLDRFEKTLDDDIHALDFYDIDFNTRNCLVQTSGEKKVLIFHMELISILVNKIPQVSSEKTQGILKLQKNLYNEIDRYVTEVLAG